MSATPTSVLETEQACGLGPEHRPDTAASQAGVFSNGCAMDLPAEDDEGAVEYKRMLVSPSRERFEELVTQLKYRMAAGHGEALYQLGYDNDGKARGISDAGMDASLATLKRMAAELAAEATTVLRCRAREGDVAQVLVRCKPRNCEEFTDLRICVSGNVDAGKSSLLGVLCGNGQLDNGRGLSRAQVLTHKHELETGRTSAISTQLMGFDAAGRVVNYASSGSRSGRTREIPQDHHVRADGARARLLHDGGGAQSGRAAHDPRAPSHRAGAQGAGVRGAHQERPGARHGGRAHRAGPEQDAQVARRAQSAGAGEDVGGREHVREEHPGRPGGAHVCLYGHRRRHGGVRGVSPRLGVSGPGGVSGAGRPGALYPHLHQVGALQAGAGAATGGRPVGIVGVEESAPREGAQGHGDSVAQRGQQRGLHQRTAAAHRLAPGGAKLRDRVRGGSGADVPQHQRARRVSAHSALQHHSSGRAGDRHGPRTGAHGRARPPPVSLPVPTRVAACGRPVLFPGGPHQGHRARDAVGGAVDAGTRARFLEYAYS
eukprot:ctg_1010.g335